MVELNLPQKSINHSTLLYSRHWCKDQTQAAKSSISFVQVYLDSNLRRHQMATFRTSKIGLILTLKLFKIRYQQFSGCAKIAAKDEIFSGVSVLVSVHQLLLSVKPLIFADQALQVQIIAAKHHASTFMENSAGGKAANI